MPTRPNLHLKGFRKRSALTQADVARLLGRLSTSPVSRLETGEQAPDLRTAFCLELIFGASASQLFRHDFTEVAAKVRERAELLDDGLRLQSDSVELRRRRGELKAVIARIGKLDA